MLTAAQIGRLDSVLAGARRRHPELGRPLASAALRTVLRREGIFVKVLPHPRDAELLAIEGRWVLIVDERRPHRERLIAAAHEYGHFIAHVDPAEPISFDASPPWYDEQREAEADYLAELLVRGPAPRPPGTAASARRGRANSRRVDPDQLALDAPGNDANQPTARASNAESQNGRNCEILKSPAADARAYERRIVQRGAKKLTPRIAADRRTPDDERIEWGNGTRPTRYLEADGHRWTIYNCRIVTQSDGQSAKVKLALVRDFMDRRATHRIFVDSAGTRRVYRFVPRELRAYKVKHLERQLDEAKPWKRRVAPRSQTAELAQ